MSDNMFDDEFIIQMEQQVGDAVVQEAVVGDAVMAEAVVPGVMERVVEPMHNIYHEMPGDLFQWPQLVARFDDLHRLQLLQQDTLRGNVEIQHRQGETFTDLVKNIELSNVKLSGALRKIAHKIVELNTEQQVQGNQILALGTEHKAFDTKLTEMRTSLEDLKKGVGERGAQVQNTVENTARVAQQVAVAVHENGQSPNARLILELIMRYGMDTLNGYVVAFPVVDGGRTYFVVCLTLLMALLKKFRGFKEQGITNEKTVCDLLRSLPSCVLSARRSTQEKALAFFCTRMYAARGAATNLQRVFHIFDFEAIVHIMRSLRNTLGDQPAADEHEWAAGKNTMWTRTHGNVMRWGERTNMLQLRERHAAEYDAMMRVVQMPDNPAAVVHFNGLQATNYEPPVHSGRPAKEPPGTGGRKRPAQLQIQADNKQRKHRQQPDDEGGVEESKESDSDRSNSNDSDDEDSSSSSSDDANAKETE